MILKRSITCYKIVERDTLKSHSFNYYYEVGKTLKSELLMNKDGTVDLGFHFMSCYESCVDLLIGNPLYSKHKNSILECIIPSGSLVYIGIHGDLATDTCIVSKVINDFISYVLESGHIIECNIARLVNSNHNE
jgi:hypothetical protein